MPLEPPRADVMKDRHQYGILRNPSQAVRVYSVLTGCAHSRPAPPAKGVRQWHLRFRRSAVIACLAAFLAATTVTGCAEERPAATEYRGIDFSQDEAANGAASQLGQRLLRDLPGQPGYAGLQIVRTGIQVDVVGEATPEMRAVVARHALRYQGSEIPVSYRSVRYSEKELQAVASQVTADRDDWAKRGVEFSSWGIDLDTNTVKIALLHYTKAYGTALLERYGERVTVEPRDVVIVPA